MKTCPVCNRNYADDSQNFCLEDGATLIAANSNFGGAQQTAQSWQPQNFVGGQQQPKKSKSAFWILGILGAVAVLGVVGLFGVLVLIGMLADNANNNNRTTNVIANSTRGNSTLNNRSLNLNSGVKSNANSSLNFNSSIVSNNLKYDRIDWGTLDLDSGHGEYISGEYQVYSKKSDSYFVVIIGRTIEDEYVTKNAMTKVTARSISGVSPFAGYGLIVHSDPMPLKSDYAFLIRTDKNPEFRIVKHSNKVETEIVKWTPAAQIRTGGQPNDLEVRSDGKTLGFYINGQYAASVDDDIASDGIVGLYTSGTPVVAFSDLKIYDNK